ncbi:hypothetical protein FRX31_007922, partial [Thalictrum thalictroides]
MVEEAQRTLKEWNREVFGRVDRKIEERVDRINALDPMEELNGLSDDEFLERGTVTRDGRAIREHVEKFYKGLFAKDTKVRPKVDLHHLDSISMDQKDILEAHFTEEIVRALESMEGEKSPGPE